MFASLLSLRNFAIVAAISLASVMCNVALLKHLWTVEANDKAQMAALTSANASDVKATQDAVDALDKCTGTKADAQSRADVAIAKAAQLSADLEKAKRLQTTARRKLYETPDCISSLSLPVCAAVSDSVRAGPG